MIIKGKKNPTTCIELATLLGWPVKQWTEHPDGSVEVDIDGNPTEAQQKDILARLEVAKTHLADNGNGLEYWRQGWEQAKTITGTPQRQNAMLLILARKIGLELS